MIGIPTSRIVLGIDGSRKKLTRIRRFKPMYEANHDDDPKHPVPRGLLGVLRCYGTLCEEVGSHLVGVDRMQRNFEPRKKQVEAWKGTRLPDETAFRHGVMELLKRCGCIFQPDWPSRKTHSAVLLSNFDR